MNCYHFHLVYLQTAVTFTDLGSGRSPYPSLYFRWTRALTVEMNGGVQLCGGTGNVESQHSYELGPMVVDLDSDGLWNPGEMNP